MKPKQAITGLTSRAEKDHRQYVNLCLCRASCQDGTLFNSFNPANGNFRHRPI